MPCHHMRYLVSDDRRQFIVFRGLLYEAAEDKYISSGQSERVHILLIYDPECIVDLFPVADSRDFPAYLINALCHQWVSVQLDFLALLDTLRNALPYVHFLLRIHKDNIFLACGGIVFPRSAAGHKNL